MRYLLPVCLICLLFSCTDKNDLPEGILKPDKMQDVFWDFIRADIFTTEFIRRDSSKNPVIENLKLQDKIFNIHHTSKEEFYKSYIYYSNHKELMTTIIDSMIARKQREKLFSKPTLKSL